MLALTTLYVNAPDTSLSQGCSSTHGLYSFPSFIITKNAISEIRLILTTRFVRARHHKSLPDDHRNAARIESDLTFGCPYCGMHHQGYGGYISSLSLFLFVSLILRWLEKKGINSKDGCYLNAMTTNLINIQPDSIPQLTEVNL